MPRRAIVLRFDKDNWNLNQAVYVYAVDDPRSEGDRRPAGADQAVAVGDRVSEGIGEVLVTGDRRVGERAVRRDVDAAAVAGCEGARRDGEIGVRRYEIEIVDIRL